MSPVSSGIEKNRGVLNKKEYAVAQLISEGYSRRKIKKMLHVDANYLKIHIGRIREKIKEAISNGTVKVGEETEERGEEEVPEG